MDLFEIINDITFNKKYNFNEKSYPQYIINKFLSMRKDTLYFANEMNKYDLDKQLQYDFYFYSIPKKKRFFKYTKYDAEENIKIVSDYFKVRIDVARRYLNFLSNEELQKIKDSFNKGGINKPKK